MDIFETFTNQYSVTKTLRFELIPERETLEFLERDGILNADEQRAEDYKRLKLLLDEYYRDYIDKVLSNVSLEGLEEFEQLYFVNNRTEIQKQEFTELQESLRKQIVNYLESDEAYNSLFKKDIIEKELPKFLKGKSNRDDDFALVESFKGFTTICTGFWKNRENLFSDEEKSTAIAYRIVHENLPKFLDNKRLFTNFLNNTSVLNGYERDLNEIFELVNVKTLDTVFSLDYFNMTLTQRGIDSYNSILGGFSKEDGTKIKAQISIST